MGLMLQADEPDDYVVATGEAHTVEEFVAAAFDHAAWTGGITYAGRVAGRDPARRRPWWAIRRRSGSGWAGSRPSGSASSVARMVEADLEWVRRASEG